MTCNCRINFLVVVVVVVAVTIAIVAGYDSRSSGHPNHIVSYRGFGVGSRSGSTMFRLNY
jgi:hypothetical protein